MTKKAHQDTWREAGQLSGKQDGGMGAWAPGPADRPVLTFQAAVCQLWGLGLEL